MCWTMSHGSAEQEQKNGGEGRGEMKTQAWNWGKGRKKKKKTAGWTFTVARGGRGGKRKKWETKKTASSFGCTQTSTKDAETTIEMRHSLSGKILVADVVCYSHSKPTQKKFFSSSHGSAPLCGLLLSFGHLFFLLLWFGFVCLLLASLHPSHFQLATYINI